MDRGRLDGGIMTNDEILVEIDTESSSSPTYPLNLLVPDELDQPEKLYAGLHEASLLGAGDARPGGDGRLVDISGGQSAHSELIPTSELIQSTELADGAELTDDHSPPADTADMDMEAIFEEARMLADQFAQMAERSDISPAHQELLDAPMSLPGDSELLSLESQPAPFVQLSAAESSAGLTPSEAVRHALAGSRADRHPAVSPAQAALSALIISGVVPPQLTDDHLMYCSPSMRRFDGPTTGISPFNFPAEGMENAASSCVSRINGGTFTRQKVTNGNSRATVEGARYSAGDMAWLDNQAMPSGSVHSSEHLTSQHVATSARNLEYSVRPVSNGVPADISQSSAVISANVPPLKDRNGNSAVHSDIVQAEERLDPPDPAGITCPPISSVHNSLIKEGTGMNEIQRNAVAQAQMLDDLPNPADAFLDQGAERATSNNSPERETKPPSPSSRNLQRKETFVSKPSKLSTGTYRVDKKKRFGTFKVDKSLVAAAAAEVNVSAVNSQQEGEPSGEMGSLPAENREESDQWPHANTYPFSSEPESTGLDSSPPRQPLVPESPAVGALARYQLTSTPVCSGGSSGSSLGLTPIRRHVADPSAESPVPNPSMHLRLRGPALPAARGSLRPAGVRASGLRQPGLRQPMKGLPQATSGLQQPGSVVQQESGLRQPISGLRQPMSGLRQPSSGLKQPTAGLRQPAVSGLRQPSNTSFGKQPANISANRHSGNASLNRSAVRQPAGSTSRQPAGGVRQSSAGPRQPPAAGARQLPGAAARQLPGAAARQRYGGVSRSGSDNSVCSGPNHSRSNPSLIEDRVEAETSGIRQPTKSQLPGPVSRIPSKGVSRSAALTGSLTNINLQTTYGGSAAGAAPRTVRLQDSVKKSLSPAAPPADGDCF